MWQATHPSRSQEELIKWQTPGQRDGKKAHHRTWGKTQPLGSERGRDVNSEGRDNNPHNVVMDYSMASMGRWLSP